MQTIHWIIRKLKNNKTKAVPIHIPTSLFGDKLRAHRKLAQIGEKQMIALAEY